MYAYNEGSGKSAPCADPEGFVRGGSNSTNVFFFLFSGGEDPNTIKSGPFKWRLAGGLMMVQHNTLNAGLNSLCFFRESGPVMLRNPIFLSFSRDVRTLAPPLSGSAFVRNCAYSAKPSLLYTATSTKLSYAGLYILRDNHSSIHSHLVGQTSKHSV